MSIQSELTLLANIIRGKYFTNAKLSVHDMVILTTCLYPTVNAMQNEFTDSFNLSTNWIGVSASPITKDRGYAVYSFGPKTPYLYQTVKSAELNTLYAWSFYAKADNKGDKVHTEIFGGHGYADFTLDTNWQVCYSWGSFGNVNNKNVYFAGVSSNKGLVYIANPVLVKLPWGGVPTVSSGTLLLSLFKEVTT